MALYYSFTPSHKNLHMLILLEGTYEKPKSNWKKKKHHTTELILGIKKTVFLPYALNRKRSCNNIRLQALSIWHKSLALWSSFKLQIKGWQISLAFCSFLILLTWVNKCVCAHACVLQIIFYVNFKTTLQNFLTNDEHPIHHGLHIHHWYSETAMMFYA